MGAEQAVEKIHIDVHGHPPVQKNVAVSVFGSDASIGSIARDFMLFVVAAEPSP
jgi:hypothetical protein